MDANELTMEEKCQILMDTVVEYRKRYGKLATHYINKASVTENKMLEMELQGISKHRKPKNFMPDIDVEKELKESEEFMSKIISHRQRVEKLYKRVKDTQEIVLQLQQDKITRKANQPLTVDVLLKHIKDTKAGHSSSTEAGHAGEPPQLN